MRTTLAIAKKELTTYLTTSWAWVVFTATSFITSMFFIIFLVNFKRVQDEVRVANGGWAAVGADAQVFRNLTDGVIVNLWGTVLVVTLFVAPFLSMRLFAEERRQKTFELLMTTPIRASEIVFGKYLGALGIIGCTLGLTIVYPLILAFVGRADAGGALEWSTVLLGYAGLLLWGAALMAIGLFVSALTDSQMVAALVSFAIAMGWMLINALVPVTEEPLHSVLAYLSFDHQLQSLLKGVLDLRPIVFFGSVIAVFLLMTHRAVEAQRWA